MCAKNIQNQIKRLAPVWSCNYRTACKFQDDVRIISVHNNTYDHICLDLCKQNLDKPFGLKFRIVSTYFRSNKGNGLDSILFPIVFLLAVHFMLFHYESQPELSEVHSGTVLKIRLSRLLSPAPSVRHLGSSPIAALLTK